MSINDYTDTLLLSILSDSEPTDGVVVCGGDRLASVADGGESELGDHLLLGLALRLAQLAGRRRRGRQLLAQGLDGQVDDLRGAAKCLR